MPKAERRGDSAELQQRLLLLTPKLHPPHLHAPLVSRVRLLDRLDGGMQRKITLISAPAGFGKTTLIASWLARRTATDHAEPDGLPVAWLSLDEGDNDPVRFWRYVLTTCQAFDAKVGRISHELLLTQRSQRPPFEAMLATFLNDLARLPCKGMLVLEDYHIVTSQQIHETLAHFVEHLPPTMHLVILTRSDPPLPLARLRAHNDLNELRATDLRFSSEEATTFLKHSLPFPLSPEAINRLTTRTEGWAAGLQLAALALQGHEDPREIEHIIATFTGSHRHILEYLVTDVLNIQPASLQTFLLRTSLLSSLTGSLCDAITDQHDSTLLLERLERSNLFLMPLDQSGEWYRYHALFAEAMRHEARRRLGEEALEATYHKASLWYVQQGLLNDAVETALAAREHERAAALIERIVEPSRANHELYTYRRWLERLPQEVLYAHPLLCFIYALAIQFSSDRHAPGIARRLAAPLAIAERGFRAAGDRVRLGELLAFRSLSAWWQSDLSQAFRCARQALELLPEQETNWRGISLLHVGIEELLAGRLNAARRAVTAARALCKAARNIYTTLSSTTTLGDICIGQGALHQAAQFYKQVIAETTEKTQMQSTQSYYAFLGIKGYALLGLARLSYEWDELEEAQQLASQTLAISAQLNDETLQAGATIAQARIFHAQGESVQARQILATRIAQTNKTLLLRELLLDEARLALADGELPTVQRWAATLAESPDDLSCRQQEQEAFMLARLLLAQGEPQTALDLLKNWQAEVHEAGRTTSVLTTLLLSALANSALNQPHQAGQTLIQALEIAQPEGYRRLFLDEGEPAAALLRSVLSPLRTEHAAPLFSYVRSLALAFANLPNEPDDTPASPALLTPQEQRVLRLLASGRSRPEIAQELVVSVNTVKTQVKSIYRKLKATSRKEAFDAARHLRLL